MALWLASQPLVLASRSDVRGKILVAAGLPFEIRAATIDERAIEAQAGIDDPAGVARHLAHAPIRHWRAAPSALPSRLTGTSLPRSCETCAATRTNCTRRSPLFATVRCYFPASILPD